MSRIFSCVIATALFGAGTTAVLAEQPGAMASSDYKVKINAHGDYCVTGPAVTGSRIAQTTCKSAQAWAKDGVTFGRR